MEHRREPMGGEVDSDQAIGSDWTNDCMISSGQANSIEAANTSNVTFGSTSSDQFVDDLALKVSFLLSNLEENEPSFVENPQPPVHSAAQSRQVLDFRTLQHSNTFDKTSIKTHAGQKVLFPSQANLIPVSRGSYMEDSGSSQTSNKSFGRQRKAVDLQSTSQGSINKSYQLPKIVVNQTELNRLGLDAMQDRSSEIDACESYEVFTNTLQNVSSRSGQNKTPECEESHADQYQIPLKSYIFSGGAEHSKSCIADNKSRNHSHISHYSGTRNESLEKEAERSWSEITVKAESFIQSQEHPTQASEIPERSSQLSLSKSSCPTETSTECKDVFTLKLGVNASANKFILMGRPRSNLSNTSKLSVVDNSNTSRNVVDYSTAKVRNSNSSRLSSVGNNTASLNLVDSTARPRSSLMNTSRLSTVINKNTSPNLIGSNRPQSTRISGIDNNNVFQNVRDGNTRTANTNRLSNFDNSNASPNVDNNPRLAIPSVNQNVVGFNRRIENTSQIIDNSNSNTPLNMGTSNSRVTSTSRLSGGDNSSMSQNAPDYNTRQSTSRLSSVDNSYAVEYSNAASLASCSRPMSRASMDDWRLSLFEPSRSDFDPIGRDTPPLSASSVASSRRLEWDNGADIGYRAVPSMDWPNSTATLIPSSRTIPEMARSDPEGISLMNETINVNLGPPPTVFPYFQLNSGTSSLNLSPNQRMSSQDSSLANTDDDFLQGTNVTNQGEDLHQATNVTNPDEDFYQVSNLIIPDEDFIQDLSATNSGEDFRQASKGTGIDEDFLQNTDVTNPDESFCQAFGIVDFDNFCHTSSVPEREGDFVQTSSVTEDLLERSSSPGSLSRSDSKRSVIYNSVKDMRRQADMKIEMTHSLQPFKNMSCPNLTDIRNPLEMPDWGLSKSEEQVGTSKRVRSSMMNAFLSSGFHNRHATNLQSSYLNEATAAEEQSSYSGLMEHNRENMLVSMQDRLEDHSQNNPHKCRSCQMPLRIGSHPANSDLHYSNLQNISRGSEESFEIDEVDKEVIDPVYGISQQHEGIDQTTNDLQYVTEVPEFSCDNPHSRPVLVVSNNLSDLGGRNFSKIVSNFFQNASASDQALGSSEIKPHIRWYPFSSAATVQDIKDVSTQTAVSFVAQQSKDSASFGGQPLVYAVSSIAQNLSFVTNPSKVDAQPSKDGSSLATQTPQPSNNSSVQAVFEQDTSSPEDIVLEWLPSHLSLSQMQSFRKEDGNLQGVSPFHVHTPKQNNPEAYTAVPNSELEQTSLNQQESLKNNVLPLCDGGKSQACQSCHGDLNADSLYLSKDGKILISGTSRHLSNYLSNYSRSGSSDIVCRSSNETVFEANDSSASVLLQNPDALREERMLGVGECQTKPKTLRRESMSSTSEYQDSRPVQSSSKAFFPGSVSTPQLSVSNIKRNIPHHEKASTGVSSLVQNLVTLKQQHLDASHQQNSKNIAFSVPSLQKNIKTTTETWNELQESASKTKLTESNDAVTVPSNTQNRFVATSSNLLEFFSHNRPLSDSKYLEHNEGIPKSYSDPLLSGHGPNLIGHDQNLIGHNQDLIGHDQDCSCYVQNLPNRAQYLTDHDRDCTEHCHNQDLISDDQYWTGHDQVSTDHSQDMTNHGQDLTDPDLTSEEDADLVTFQSHAYSTFEDSELASGDGMNREKHEPDGFQQEKHRSAPKKMEFIFGDNASNQNAYIALRADRLFKQKSLLEQNKLLSSKFDGNMDFHVSQSSSAIADINKTSRPSKDENQSLPEQSGSSRMYFERELSLDPLNAISNSVNTSAGEVSNGPPKVYSSKTSFMQKRLPSSGQLSPSRKEVQVQTEDSIEKLTTNVSQFRQDNKLSNTGVRLESKSCTSMANNYISSKTQTRNENHIAPQLQENSILFSKFTKSMLPARKVAQVQTEENIGKSITADNLQFQDNFHEHCHKGDLHGRKAYRLSSTMAHDHSKDKSNSYSVNDSYTSPSQYGAVYSTGNKARQQLIDTSTCTGNIYADDSYANSVINARPHVANNCDKSTNTSQFSQFPEMQKEKQLEDKSVNKRNASRSESNKLQAQFALNNDKSTMIRALQKSFNTQNATRPVMIDICADKISPSRSISIQTQAETDNARPQRDSWDVCSKQDISPNKIGSSRNNNVGIQAGTYNLRPPINPQEQEIADICTNKIESSRKINLKTQAETNNNRPLSVPHASFDEHRPKIHPAKRDYLATNSNFVSVGIQASGSLLEADRCSFCHLKNWHFSRCPMKDRFKDILNQALEKGLPERRKLYGRSGTSFFVFSKVCPCCVNKSLQEKFNIHRAEIVERIEARQKEVEIMTGRGFFSNPALSLHQPNSKLRLKQVPVKSTASQPHSNKENIRKNKKNHLTSLNSSKQKGRQRNLNKYNMVMSKIYSQRLKSEILKGKVSFSRHEVLMNS